MFVDICPCSVVVACLLLHLLFFNTDVGIFLFIRWLCKQVHCCIFGAFIYHFNITIYISFVCNNNCSLDLYSGDLQTIIVHLTSNVSSHKTDWILFELLLPALSGLLYRRLNSLMNALEGERLSLSEIFINVNNLLAVLLLLVYLFIRFFYTALCCCLFTS